jgi:exonuclease SbcD
LKPITWIHTADWHLDEPIKGWKGAKEEFWRRREEHRETFRRVVSLTLDRQADFLFIAGDFLEHDTVTRSTVRFVIEELSRLEQTRVFITPGNHDPYRPDSPYALETWPDHVHIFKPEWECIELEQLSLTVIGRGFSDYEEPKWIPPADLGGGARKLLVVHGDFLETSKSSKYFPVPARELSKLELDAALLGHIHQPVEKRLNNQRNTLVCYPGSPEALNWKETGPRHVLAGSWDRHGIRVERVPVHTRSYEKTEVDVSGCQTREEVLDRIQAALESLRESYVTVRLTGRRSGGLNLTGEELEWMADRLKRSGHHAVWLEDGSKPDLDLDHYRRQPGVVGVFIRLMEERIQREPGRREELTEALHAGLEALLAKEEVTV